MMWRPLYVIHVKQNARPRLIQWSIDVKRPFLFCFYSPYNCECTYMGDDDIDIDDVFQATTLLLLFLLLLSCLIVFTGVRARTGKLNLLVKNKITSFGRTPHIHYLVDLQFSK